MRTRVVTDLARLAAPALVGASAFAGLGVVTAGVATPASAAGACTGTSGVTVVVQFPSGSATGCAPGSPGTALNALRSAGFPTTGVVGYGDSALCSINGYPTTVCPRMPPANAYWAIFSAKRGGSWVYASRGAAGLPAPAGSVVGFRFGSGAAPSVPVPAAVTTPKPSTSTQKTTAKPSPTSTHKAATPTRSSASTSRPSSSKSAQKTSAAAAPQQKLAAPSRSNAPTASSTAASTSAAQPTASGTTPGQGATRTPKVKATALVEKDGKKRKVITFDDGSSITVDPNSGDAKKYKVGVAKQGGKDTAAAPTSTVVPSPKNTGHPSISTSGSVPGVPVPETQKSGNGNLPGILAGVGVLGVATVGAGYAASRRRG